MQMFKSEKEFGTVKARDSRVDVRASEGRRDILPCSLLIKSMLSLQMVEQFSSVDKAGRYGLVGKHLPKRESTYARIKYSFCSDWKLNFKGTMKGLSTCARTRRSARVCVISLRLTMWTFRMVLRA